MRKNKKNTNLFANYDNFANESKPEITKISSKNLHNYGKINQEVIEKLQLAKPFKQKGPKTFYLKSETVEKLHALSKATNRSMGKIIEIAIDNLINS